MNITPKFLSCPTLSAPLRAAAYCRVSTDKDEQLCSLASQKRYFADYINQQENWQLTEVYYDEGISGTQTDRRAGFHRMMAAAARGEMDLILTKEVSRFARNTVDALFYTRKLKESGVGVLFTLDHIDTRDSDGELRLTLMAGIAQEESRKLSERVKWGQKRCMERGVVFGRDLLGYAVQNGQLFIKEDEAAIVRAIFHKYTNEGKGTSVIARELLEEGKRPMQASRWSSAVLLRILKNEKYVGDLRQKKTFTSDYLTHSRKYNRGEEEMVYLENHHAAIIDRSLWNRTQQELEKRSLLYASSRHYSSRYWCSGKILCGQCGNVFVSRSKRLKHGSRYQSWRCCAAAAYGTRKQLPDSTWIGCDNASVNDKTLLFCVQYCLRHIFFTQESRDALKAEILKEMEALPEFYCPATKTQTLQKQISHLQRKKQQSIDLMLEGIISKEDLKELLQQYETKQLLLQQEQDRQSNVFRMHAPSPHIPENKIPDTNETHHALQPYVLSLDEMLKFETFHPCLYQEILKSVTVHDKHTLDICLACTPFLIRLHVSTCGKQEHFTVKIQDASILYQG